MVSLHELKELGVDWDEKADLHIVVSTPDGMCSFIGEFFSAKDAVKLKDFCEKTLGKQVSLFDINYPFANALNPLRHKNDRVIDWTDWHTYMVCIKNRNKDYTAIATILNAPDSGYAVKLKMSDIMIAYSDWLEQVNGEPTEQMLEQFCKRIASIRVKTDTKVADEIEKMQKKGCTVTDDQGYPECLSGFHTGCIGCVHNKEAGVIIKDQTDIDRYNKVLNSDEFE